MIKIQWHFNWIAGDVRIPRKVSAFQISDSAQKVALKLGARFFSTQRKFSILRATFWFRSCLRTFRARGVILGIEQKLRRRRNRFLFGSGTRDRKWSIESRSHFWVREVSKLLTKKLTSVDTGALHDNEVNFFPRQENNCWNFKPALFFFCTSHYLFQWCGTVLAESRNFREISCNNASPAAAVIQFQVENFWKFPTSDNAQNLSRTQNFFLKNGKSNE